MMKLCELVRGYKTSDEALAVAREFAEGVGKTCIVVNRDVAGFVTTRLTGRIATSAESATALTWSSQALLAAATLLSHILAAPGQAAEEGTGCGWADHCAAAASGQGRNDGDTAITSAFTLKQG